MHRSLHRRTVALPRAAGIYLVGTVLLVDGVLALGPHFYDEPLSTVVFYAVMDVGLPLFVLGIGVHLARLDLERAEIRVVTAWLVGALVVFSSLFLWSRLPDLLAGTPLVDLQPDLALYGNVGAVMGAVSGLYRAQASQNARLVEQTAAQQETLTFVNHLLRHNLLNGLQVIDGYVSFLEPHTDADGRRYLRRIDDRSDHMAALIDNVRILVGALGEGISLRPVNCSVVLDREASVARAAYPNAVITTDVPPNATVTANETLGAVFENLFTNAVVHHDGAVPTIEVSAMRRGEFLLIRVEDDGPGLPPSVAEDPFGEGIKSNESSGDGLGLYLVGTLVATFGGTVRVEDVAPRGTAFIVELSAVDAN
jgi:signal transduction histidine kinase